MPTTVVITDIVHASSGKVFVRYASGTEKEFASLEELTQEIQGLDDDEGTTEDLALAWILARQPSLVNINPIKGKNFIYDLSSPNPIKVQ